MLPTRRQQLNHRCGPGRAGRRDRAIRQALPLLQPALPHRSSRRVRLRAQAHPAILQLPHMLHKVLPATGACRLECQQAPAAPAQPPRPPLPARHSSNARPPSSTTPSTLLTRSRIGLRAGQTRTSRSSRSSRRTRRSSGPSRTSMRRSRPSLGMRQISSTSSRSSCRIPAGRLLRPSRRRSPRRRRPRKRRWWARVRAHQRRLRHRLARQLQTQHPLVSLTLSMLPLSSHRRLQLPGTAGTRRPCHSLASTLAQARSRKPVHPLHT